MRATTSGKRAASACLKTRAHLLTLLEPLRHHDRLGEEVVGQGDVDRQIEADGALADIGGETLDIRVGGEQLVDTLGNVACGQDRGIVLQFQVHQKLGAVGGGKELLRHEAGPGKRCGEQSNRDRDGDPLGPHRRQQAAPEQAHRRTQGLAMRMLWGAQQRQADNRCKQAGDHPGGQQRQGHHGEQREGVLAGIAAGEAHGQEPRDGDQRSGEPRIGGGGIGEDGGLLLVVAALQAEDHALDGDHGVVHQQAERDDESAERDALKVDAEGLHRPEYDRQHQRNRDDDDGARAQAEAHHAHREDDGDRLPQRFHEFIDRLADRFRLVRHHDRFDADRQVGLQLLHGLLDVAAEREHVAAVAHGNRQAQAGLAVDAEDRVRRIGVLPPHLGDVGQSQDPFAHGEVDGEDVLLGHQRAADPQFDRLRVGGDDAGRDHDVLRLQRRRQRRRREAVSGQLRGRELDVDALRLGADQVHLGDVGHLQQPRADILDIVAQLAMREPVRGEAIDDAIGVAELVVADRTMARPAARSARCRAPSCEPGTRCPTPPLARSIP